MATNPWISQSVRSEQSLYEDLIIESLQFYGQDVYYIPREIVNKDKVFLDDVPSHFSDAYKIEMYIENVDAFAGEGDLFSKFGVELRDQATFVCARRRWKGLIGEKLDSYNFRPREGDLIYLPLSQSIFEIFKVETESPFYQLSQLPTFRLQCELFEYNDEDFDTDIDTIDIIEEESAYQYKLTMKTPAVATATATASIDEDGQVTSITSTDGGAGYVTAPTVTVLTNSGSGVFKFGNSSLDASIRGIEGNYIELGNHGYVEFWFNLNDLPNPGTQQIFFVTGGIGETSVQKYLWGVSSSGKLIYSKGDNEGGGIVSPIDSTTITTGVWHHVLIGVDNTDELYIYYDFEKKLDATVSGVTFNWFTNDGYSVGSDAARTSDGISWTVLDGYIDEIRAEVGTRSLVLTSRYDGDSDTLVTQTAEWSPTPYTGFLNHFTAITATATATVGTDGTVSSFTVTESGIYYDTEPTVTISAPYSSTLNYERNELVTQNQGTFSMKGEVAKWSDSDSVLYLTHVGSTDGLYHTFNTTNAVVGASSAASYAPSLVEEINQIQSVGTVGNDVVAQNDYFDDFEANFLDFSESNPFGDVS